jgi:hypothetical protein
LLAFDTHDHVVLLAEGQAYGFPGAEMVTGVNGTADVHFGADGPVLLEVCVVTGDGGRIDTLFLPDFVGTTVRVNMAIEGCRGVVGGVVLAHCPDD